MLPKVVQLFFYSVGIVFIIVGWFRSRARRQRKKDSRIQGKPLKMSSHERLEIGLFNLGWTTSWALGMREWEVRAILGVVSLLWVLKLLYQIDFRADDPATYDQASTLHMES